MRIETFEAKGLAHYSYILSSEGKAAIIDPRRDVDEYLGYLESRKLKLEAILETHIHADYASGARQIAAATGAPMYLSAYDKGEVFSYKFPHEELRDHQSIDIGDLRIEAIHTPGHTPEHLSFLLFEKSRCGQPLALFTGDFVFAGSLGRPDLLGEDEKTALAKSLYRSVHDRIRGLGDGVIVYPGHGAGSLCGAHLSERPFTTLGYERFCNIFMEDQPEDQFVRHILATVPEFPDYYRRMKRLNSDSAPMLDGIPGGAQLPVEDFASLVESGAAVVDLRTGAEFGAGHIPGALNIGAGNAFGLYAPFVVPDETPILLVGGSEEARRALIRVGLDDIRGTLAGGMQAWVDSGKPIAQIAQAKKRDLPEGTPILDARKLLDFTHLPIPGTDPAIASPVAVMCMSGYRSAIAASLLRRGGYKNVINISGGMAEN
jgi:hydroxyacylglutathione hydrolase